MHTSDVEKLASDTRRALIGAPNVEDTDWPKIFYYTTIVQASIFRQ